MAEPVKIRMTYVGELDQEKETFAAFYEHPIAPPGDQQLSFFNPKKIKKGLGYKPVIGYTYEVERPEDKPTSIIPSTMRVIGPHEHTAEIVKWRVEDEARSSEREAIKKSKLDDDIGTMTMEDLRRAYQRLPGMHREHVLAKLVAYLHRR